MNLKLKAGLYTAAIVGAIYIALFVISAIYDMMPDNWRSNSFYVIVIGLFLYGVYGTILSTLEFKEKMKQISDRK